MDIRIRVDLFEHKKWLRLCKTVGRGDALGLFQLWAWCAVFRSRGDLSDRTDEQIAASAGIPAERAAAFCAALRYGDAEMSPWLEPNGMLHDWREEQAYAYHFEDRREEGRRSAHRRWSTRRIIPRTAPAKLDPINPSTPRAPMTEKHRHPAEDPLFEQFWDAYPRKVGKGAALKAWKKIQNKAETLVLCKEALAWQTTQEQWTRDTGDYIPHPATYLNQQRWLDEKPDMTAFGEPEPVRPMEPIT